MPDYQNRLMLAKFLNGNETSLHTVKQILALLYTFGLIICKIPQPFMLPVLIFQFAKAALPQVINYFNVGNIDADFACYGFGSLLSTQIRRTNYQRYAFAFKLNTGLACLRYATFCKRRMSICYNRIGICLALTMTDEDELHFFIVASAQPTQPERTLTMRQMINSHEHKKALCLERSLMNNDLVPCSGRNSNIRYSTTRRL